VRASTHLLMFIALIAAVIPCSPQEPNQSRIPPKISSAQSVFFDDQSGSRTVGVKALHQLYKWGRFNIIKDPKQADLILLLSASPYKGGYIIYSGGQTGTIQKDGRIEEDEVPTYGKATPVRYVFLTVIDPKTGESLWNDSHAWGGLLTGFDSAGERLVSQFRKQIQK
jgi:hypothetical protein